MPAIERRKSPREEASYIASFIRWLQLKIYQYEVTFSLYMLTPREKFIFNSVIFVLFSMLLIAASLYLPNHIVIIYNRIWYYVRGEIVHITGNVVLDQALKTSNAIAETMGMVTETTMRAVGPTSDPFTRRPGEL